MTKMIKGATMWTCDGVQLVQIAERLANGRAGEVRDYPINSKAEAMAIAKREGAKFTA